MSTAIDISGPWSVGKAEGSMYSIDVDGVLRVGVGEVWPMEVRLAFAALSRDADTAHGSAPCSSEVRHCLQINGRLFIDRRGMHCHNSTAEGTPSVLI